MIAEQQDIQERLKIIVDDDCAVIDYLSDRPDREALRQLQKFVDFGNNQPNAILDKEKDGLYILILYKPPFDALTGNNKLALYSHRRLSALCAYFQRMGEALAGKGIEVATGIKEILELLDYQRNIEIDKNAQLNHMG